jgi:excinuclease ABC subunit A
VKLSSELQKRSTGRTVYVLDEPTTGLHFEDIRKLLRVLEDLVDKGNTVIVIEHNLDVVKTADWLIDMGPAGGHKGGSVIAVGSPEEMAEVEASHTGQFLRHVLGLEGAPKGSDSAVARAHTANGGGAAPATSTSASGTTSGETRSAGKRTPAKAAATNTPAKSTGASRAAARKTGAASTSANGSGSTATTAKAGAAKTAAVKKATAKAAAAKQ